MSGVDEKDFFNIIGSFGKGDSLVRAKAVFDHDS